MKTWEEMSETERAAMLSPTRERLSRDGTSVRVPKIKTAKEWKLYLQPYMEMKFLEAMSLSHEGAAFLYALSSCTEIIDDALLAHDKLLLSELTETTAENLELRRKQRQRGGYKRHWLTNLVKDAALRHWAAKSESERNRWGARTEFAHWVQATFKDKKRDPIPKDPKNVSAWITEWEKRKQQLPQ